MTRINKICGFLVLLLWMACKQESVDIYSLAAHSEQGVNAVIEIPAGSNHKIEFNPSTGKFEVDQENEKDRIVDFLPYPANYGFIPSTLMDEERGGDGDALDILVIAERVETGTALQVTPIATLLLQDQQETDTKIIAVPVDSSLAVIRARDYQSFMIEYSAAKQIIQDWFLNYKGLGKVRLLGWRNEAYAREEIKKWAVKLKN